MVVQNNPTPWIVLALVVMAGCLLTGMMLDKVGPFNPVIAEGRLQITQTQAALQARATQTAMEADQAQARQTEVIEQLTAMPHMQAATQVAQVAAAQAAQGMATQVAWANAAQNEQLMAQATQTALEQSLLLNGQAAQATLTTMAQNQEREKSLTVVAIGVIGLGAVTLCGWILARAFLQASLARAQELTSRAQLLAEERRLAALRASLRAKEKPQGIRYPLPRSLMTKRPPDEEGLPKAE